jgi:hypothetical protein
MTEAAWLALFMPSLGRNEVLAVDERLQWSDGGVRCGRATWTEQGRTSLIDARWLLRDADAAADFLAARSAREVLPPLEPPLGHHPDGEQRWFGSPMSVLTGLVSPFGRQMQIPSFTVYLRVGPIVAMAHSCDSTTFEFIGRRDLIISDQLSRCLAPR